MYISTDGDRYQSIFDKVYYPFTCLVTHLVNLSMFDKEYWSLTRYVTHLVNLNIYQLCPT